MRSARPTIGARGRRFILDLPRETPDGFGGVVRSFEPGPALWGSIEALRAGDRVRADRTESAATHRITLPFRPDVTGANRLSLGPRRFRVAAAFDPDGRRRSLVCLAEEVLP